MPSLTLRSRLLSVIAISSLVLVGMVVAPTESSRAATVTYTPSCVTSGSDTISLQPGDVLEIFVGGDGCDNYVWTTNGSNGTLNPGISVGTINTAASGNPQRLTASATGTPTGFDEFTFQDTDGTFATRTLQVKKVSGVTGLAWGFNGDGQLGNGSTTSSANPVAPTSSGINGRVFTQVSAGDDITCAVANDESVWCWGNGASGALGNGSSADSSTPVQVVGVGGSGTLSGISAVEAGNTAACALATTGSVYCWGYGGDGQLGNGGVTDSPSPVAVSGLTNVTAISAGRAMCAVKADGSLWCWGFNADGQVGDGTTTNQTTPVQVVGVGGAGHLTGVTAVGAGPLNTCAVASGALYCWGTKGGGVLGDGSRESGAQATPVAVSVLTSGVTSVDVGQSNACAIRSGAAYCWGLNSVGQVGTGDIGSGNDSFYWTIPQAVTNLTSGVTQMAVGSNHVCAVAADLVYCWGENDDGQLGNPTPSETATPQALANLTTSLTPLSLSAGIRYSAAIFAESVCAMGSYSTAGRGVCAQAAAGNFVDIVGATQQTACPIGTLQANVGSISCDPAPAGSYVNTTGASSATPCDPGTYQPSTGMITCLQSPANTYVSTFGATAATACPPGTSSPIGSTAISACIGSGGGGGSSAGPVAPTATSTPDPDSLPTIPPPASALGSGQSLGSVQVFDARALAPAEVNRSGTSLVIVGAGWQQALEVAGDSGGGSTTGMSQPLPVLRQGGSFALRGTGALPGTAGAVVAFSAPLELATFVVDADGAFFTRVTVPEGLAPGVHTIQVNSYSGTGFVRSVNMGLPVADVAPLPLRITFPIGSAKLSKVARDRIRVWVAEADRAYLAQATVVIQQPRGSSRAQKRLVAQRLRAVVSFVERAGLDTSVDARVSTGGKAARSRVAVISP